MKYAIAPIYTKYDSNGNSYRFLLVWDAESGRFLGALDESEAARLGLDKLPHLERLPAELRHTRGALRKCAPPKRAAPEATS